MGRQFGQQRVDLLEALALLEPAPLPAANYLDALLDRFACSPRSAADAIAILKQAGYLERRSPTDGDGRRKQYEITERGRQLLSHPEAGRLLRHARKLFTTCPSPKERRKRSNAPNSSPKHEFQRREQLILTLVTGTAADRPEDSTTVPSL